jgi:hypothetical protein
MATHHARTHATRSPPPEASEADELLDCAGSIPGAYAMVFGRASPEILCGLIRRGAAAAAHLRRDDRSSAMPNSDLIILPHCGDLAKTAEALALARHHMAPGGRVVLRGTGAARVPELAALLTTTGFSHIRCRALPFGTVVTADLPFFGPLGGRQ